MAKMSALCVVLGLGSFALKNTFASPLTWFFVCGGGFATLYFAFGFSLLSEGRESAQKVLMLTPGLFIGGLERMILNLSKSLKSSSLWQPQVLAYDFAPTDASGSDLISAFQSLEIPVQSKVKPPRFSLKTAAQIASTISRDGVTVIHTHDLGALIYGAIAKIFLFNRVKLVHTQHSFVHLNRSWKYRYYERFFTLFANAISVVSEDTGHSYQKLGVPKNKLHLIPNGVDFPSSPDLDRCARIARRPELLQGLSIPLPISTRIDLNSYWIIYLARIHGRKGQDHALKIWNLLPVEARSKCSLIFVGPETESGEWARIQSLIDTSLDSERILMAGPSLHPNEWLKASDLYLSCSEFEGMPLSPIEAIGSGIPAILSKIPGHDFLEPYAKTYSLEEPEMGALLLNHTITRIEEDDQKFRNELWSKTETLRTNFTLATMSKHYAKLYGLKS